MNLSPEFARALFKNMLRIRMTELQIESSYGLDEMKTPIHLCIGQEASAVGACAALTEQDGVFSNHRGHGHYLAKGGDLKRMIAELHCKSTGCSKGKGGSMHLIDLSAGYMGSSSIVGGSIPIAVGLALAHQMKGEPRVSAVFFGDGALDEGVLYESVNFAMLKRLPVLFLYENNQWSVCSPKSARHPCEPIFHSVPPDLMFCRKADGNDVEAVYEAASQAVQRGRSGLGPSFLQLETYRMRGHAGSGADVKLGYRTEEEIARWAKEDPLDRFRDKLVSESVLTEEHIGRMGAEILAEIEEAFESARKGPLPEERDLYLHLYRN